MSLWDTINARYRDVSTFWEGEASGAAVLFSSASGGNKEQTITSLVSEAQRMYQTNGVVWSVILARIMVFSQARFTFQSKVDKRTFGKPTLGLLEYPWPNGTTSDLLARMEQDVSLAGNAYIWKPGPDRLVRMPPQEVTIVSHEVDGYRDVLGYDWDPTPTLFGDRSEKAQFLTVDEVAHYCADEATEILTADGWKTYDQLKAGDETLTLNHETGMSEWQPVKDVFIFPKMTRPMVSLEGSEHSSLTTEDHRWPVERKNSRAGGYVRKWATSSTLSSGDRIPTAAQCADVPVEAKWSDALVEMVAWYWTEGCRLTRKGRLTRAISISQSYVQNPANADRIRAALRVLFGEARSDNRLSHSVPRWNERVDGQNIIFRLSSAAADVITAHAPGAEKVVETEFLRSLTQAQLEMFINISMLADGHGSRLGQKSSARADQFALAGLLAGNAVSIRQGSENRYGYRMNVVRLKKARHVYPQENSRPGSKFKVTRTTYDGHVWCPSTDNQSWLARRNGSVYFTGNCPLPDPSATFRGMSWLTPVIREIYADKELTDYKSNFLANSATPSMLVKYAAKLRPDTIDSVVQRFQAKYGGANGLKTLVLDQGADATPMGSTFDQLNLTAVMTAGAERICAAGGVPMDIAGLQGASSNAEWGASMRRFADITLRFLWESACGSLEPIVDGIPDQGVRLWYDVTDVAALRQSETERAQTIQVKAAAILTLEQAGYTRESVVAAVVADDLTQLVAAPLAPPAGVKEDVKVTDQLVDGQNPSPVTPPNAPQIGPRNPKPQTPATKAAMPSTFAHIPSVNASKNGRG